MSAGDLSSDLRQRTIRPSLELETVVESHHGVGSTAPFPNKTGAQLQARLRRL